MGACCLSCDRLFELEVFDVGGGKTAEKHAGVGDKKGCGRTWIGVEQKGGPSRLTHADKTTRGS